MSHALILMYHQVNIPVTTQEQRFCTTPDAFRRQMAWLTRAGYQTVDLESILAYVSGVRELPKKAIHVTFDDGFTGVLEHAWPVLKELGISATLFALPGLAGRTNEWMWQRGFPRRALLSAEQIRLLAEEGMTIGSHTCTHPHLTEIPFQQAEEEIARSKHELEELLGREVVHFAYPYGQVNIGIRELVERSGYRSACSTRSGFNRRGEDPYLLRRIDVFGTDKLWQFRQKLLFGSNKASRLDRLSYLLGRITGSRSRQS